ncbi:MULTISPECIES: LuxR C-terminal-related transcriptional regulator [unclassified Halomonas]|uniref:LuxR C-terminal-related transcriptional regulator n=1 Tax=unclassified Halomonas TaxID=2609666 RepID=UPI001F368220|nr:MULTISPECIES: LuxR C-terminal-related transcriptional regulator [unclassified Halomonas]
MMDDKLSGIFIVTDASPQSQLFNHYVADHLNCSVRIVDKEELVQENIADVLVLLDADHIDGSTLKQCQDQATSSEGVAMAMLNLRDDEHAINFFFNYNLTGCFYRRDSLEQICRGLEVLLDGGLWMSRSLMSRLITSYRDHRLGSYQPPMGLSHRELDVIAQLASGASNREIADKLFVSEHTVKTHLYNVYRKIGVHSRLQAMAWARHNLVGLERYAGRAC